MREPQVKGQRVNGLVAVIRQLAPPERYEEMVRSLSVNTQALLAKPPAATAWVPIGPIDEILRKALSIAYAGEVSKVFEQGRLSFIRDVKTVYKVFIRFLSPHYVAHRASQIYATYYKDNGSLQVIEETPSRIRVRYDDVIIGSPAFWEQSRGSIHGALEATGMDNVRVDFVSGGGELKACEMQAVWS